MNEADVIFAATSALEDEGTLVPRFEEFVVCEKAIDECDYFWYRSMIYTLSRFIGVGMKSVADVISGIHE